jgi:hypothetical protein
MWCRCWPLKNMLSAAMETTYILVQVLLGNGQNPGFKIL